MKVLLTTIFLLTSLGAFADPLARECLKKFNSDENIRIDFVKSSQEKLLKILEKNLSSRDIISNSTIAEINLLEPQRDRRTQGSYITYSISTEILTNQSKLKLRSVARDIEYAAIKYVTERNQEGIPQKSYCQVKIDLAHSLVNTTYNNYRIALITENIKFNYELF